MKDFSRIPLGLLLLILLTSPSRGQAVGNTLIIGDASGSMKGFAKASASRLSSLYQLLFRNAPQPQLKALTTNINSVPQANFFSKQDSYKKNTDLVQALTFIHQQSDAAILVTDGMQSEGMYAGIKDQLHQMASEGWGVWLFALKIPFDGLIDTEQDLNVNDMQPAIQQCLQQDDPPGEIKLRKGTVNRYYDYEGKRPLLIFILAKNTSAGREMAKKIRSNLEADPQFAPSMKVVELSPLEYRGLSVAEGQKVDDYLEIEVSPSAQTIHSDTVDEKRVKEVHIPIMWRANEPSMPQAYTENPQVDFNQTSWLEGEPEVVQEDGPTAGHVVVKFVSELSWFHKHLYWLPFTSKHEVRSDPLSISVWTVFTKPEPAWWDEMNVDNSYQCPSRVYKLADLTKDVADVSVERHKAANPAATTEFRLIVGPLGSSD